MIITRKVRKKLAHSSDVTEYRVEYLDYNPQKYINKYIKVDQVRNELNTNDNSKLVDFNAHSEMNNIPIERTKEELIVAINTMLKQEREKQMRKSHRFVKKCFDYRRRLDAPQQCKI